MAVGEHGTSSGPIATLAERWNGKTWSVVASPKPAGTKFSRLYAVSCTSPSSCFAVGQGTTGLVEQWNGMKWSTMANPSPAGSILHGVECTSPTFCMAVGARSAGGSVGEAVFVERWNGHSWTALGTPNVANARFPILGAVACTSTVNCKAVGNFLPPDGRALPLGERWDGTAWTRVATADPAELGEGAFLVSVSCASAASCIAAGEFELGGVGRPATFVEQWTGKSWKIVKSADPARSYSALEGVSCKTATSCVAVGHYQKPRNRFDFGPTMTLAERWDGKRWSIVSSPNPGAKVSDLAGVSCWSTAHCFAVGAQTDSSTNQTLTERGNGTTWTVVASPNS
jgi:hypothetical protein